MSSLADVLALAQRGRSATASTSDTAVAQVLGELVAVLDDVAGIGGLVEIRTCRQLQDVLQTVCWAPGHQVVLRDQLGQVWVGYRGTGENSYLARPPARVDVLESIDGQVAELATDVGDVDAFRFPMLVLHAPPGSARVLAQLLTPGGG
ncbi:hypothetical protein [uncultured Cellulomonas sp.]|uniref:hypothetical protein n=1 Tax=uncultured Cellulomonas sp. TaxID=189682 RepID=UPI002633D651|nr:hypothetical protein [uncultured Cellulomonas sp.]